MLLRGSCLWRGTPVILGNAGQEAALVFSRLLLHGQEVEAGNCAHAVRRHVNAILVSGDFREGSLVDNCTYDTGFFSHVRQALTPDVEAAATDNDQDTANRRSAAWSLDAGHARQAALDFGGKTPGSPLQLASSAPRHSQGETRLFPKVKWSSQVPHNNPSLRIRLFIQASACNARHIEVFQKPCGPVEDTSPGQRQDHDIKVPRRYSIKLIPGFPCSFQSGHRIVVGASFRCLELA